MILKRVIICPNTNAVEATWVVIIEPAKTIPAKTIPASIDVSTGATIPEQIIPEQHTPAVEQVVKCHTYMDVQMDMFKADILNFGGDPADQADLIALVEANIKPVEPEPIPVPQEISKAQGIAVMSQVPVGESNLWLVVKAYFDTEADEISRDLFKAVTVFNRQSPMLNSLKAQFGLDDAGLDNLFIEGAKVVV